MLPAHQAATSLALAAAGATLITALLLTPPTSPCGVHTAGGILEARFASTQVLAGEQDLAITIRMPGEAAHQRPPLSLAVVIDRSGSMEGEPLANAKAAAARLIDQLDERDAFTVVTYSTGDETVVPMSRATSQAKAAAHDAIAGIWDDGNTCISCGIQRGSAELASTPIQGGLRRMVLISDGQANTGIYDRGELAQQAVEVSARGISVSTVGVGLDFDEVTMMNLATMGHGNYYFVEDTSTLGDMFARELSGLGTTVAADARLVITPSPGFTISEAYGYQLIRENGQLVIPIADLRAGETRNVVVHATLNAAPGRALVGQLDLHWRRVADGTMASAGVAPIAQVTGDPAAVAASVDRVATAAIERARTARVLEEATTIYQRDGYEAAQRVINRHMSDVRANKNIDAPAAAAIESAESDALVNFSKAPPAKAVKATRSSAYELAH